MDGITFTPAIVAQFTRDQVMDLRRCVVKEINRNNDLIVEASTSGRSGRAKSLAAEVARLHALKEVLMAL